MSWFCNVHISRSTSSFISFFSTHQLLKHAANTRGEKKSVWDFYLSKISAVPHAGNRRDVNSKATCGITVAVSFWSAHFFTRVPWEAVWPIRCIRREITVVTDNKFGCYFCFIFGVSPIWGTLSRPSTPFGILSFITLGQTGSLSYRLAHMIDRQSISDWPAEALDAWTFAGHVVSACRWEINACDVILCDVIGRGRGPLGASETAKGQSDDYQPVEDQGLWEIQVSVQRKERTLVPGVT